jgi:hypothetical protein
MIEIYLEFNPPFNHHGQPSKHHRVSYRLYEKLALNFDPSNWSQRRKFWPSKPKRARPRPSANRFGSVNDMRSFWNDNLDPGHLPKLSHRRGHPPGISQFHPGRFEFHRYPHHGRLHSRICLWPEAMCLPSPVEPSPLFHLCLDQIVRTQDGLNF